jgi:hypothetical protein
MTSNVFVTPRAVSTIGSGRIAHNSSLQALLQNFYSPSIPVAASVDLEGRIGLQNGIIWRQGGTGAQDGRLFVYDTNSPSHPLYSGFTREGITYISQNTFVQANAALSNNYFQAGEIIRVKDEDKLYMVRNSGTSFIEIGSGAGGGGSTAANIWQTDNTYVYYNGGLNVGIGTTTPVYDLHVSGNTFSTVYYENKGTLSGTSVTVNCLLGSVFTLTTSGNTTFTFSNPPASGIAYGFTLFIQAGGTHSLTWPASVKWSGGATPSAPASSTNKMYSFFTFDSGTNWYGVVVGESFA